MKRVVMFLLPIASLLLLGGFFVYTWWQVRVVGPEITPSPIGEGIEIEEGNKTLLENFGLSEENTTQLKNVTSELATGAVRLSEDKKSVTVVANLEPLILGVRYQVWTVGAGGEMVKLGTMKLQKAGYVLDYNFSAVQTGPMTIVISREKLDDNTLEEKVLEGSVSL